MENFNNLPRTEAWQQWDRAWKFLQAQPELHCGPEYGQFDILKNLNN